MSEIERLYSTLVNQAPVGIFRTDTRGKMIFANAALLRMAGITGEDLSYASWAPLHHPDDRDYIRRSWAALHAGKSATETFTYRMLKPDGQVAWVQARTIAAFDDDGRLEGYIGVVSDITQERLLRHQAERMSRLYETLSRVGEINARATDKTALFEALCQTIAATGLIEYVNIELVDWEARRSGMLCQAGRFVVPARYQVYDLDDPEQTNLGKLVLLHDRAFVYNDLAAAEALSASVLDAARALGIVGLCGMPLRESGRVVAALTVVSSEKDFFSAEVVALMERIGDGVSSALDNLAQNQRRLRAEEALARSERRYATLVDKAPVGILQIDRDNNEVYANAAMRAMVGAGAEESLLPYWLAHVHPDDRPGTEDYWARMQAGADVVQLGYRLLRDDGTLVSVHARGLPILDDAGGKQGYIVIATDISAEAGQRARAERLSRLYATLSRTNSIVVHARDEESLFADVCRAIVEVGGFEQVNISTVDWQRRTKRIVSDQGKWSTPKRYSERSIDDPRAQSISNVALKTGESVVFGDVVADDRISPTLRDMLQRRGLKSAIAVPLRKSGQIAGTMSILSGESGFFSDDVVRLIDEIGGDISYALDNLERIAAVARSEQHLDTTLRSIGDGVLVTDSAARITLMNPVAEALTGWPEARAIGRQVEEVFRIISEETREVASNPVARVLKEGKVVGLANHTLLIALDGSERPIADSGAPIRRTEDGAIDGAVLVFRDQTDEYRMQKNLLESRRLYATLAENVPVGIYLADANGNMSYANAQLLAILGVDAGRLSTETAAAAVHPEDRERQAKAWFDAFSRREVTDFGAFRYQTGNGDVIWANAMMAPVFDAESRVSCYVGVVKDVTREHEHLEHIERLSRFNATVSQINDAIVRGDSEADLFAAITRIAVEAGGFEMANICAIDPASGKVRLAALNSTPAMGELAEYAVRAIRAQRLSPITSAVFSEKRLALSNDIANDGSLSLSQRDFGRRLGLGAIAGLPLFRFGEVAAVLVLTSRARGHFTADILGLLDEISVGVSHALENLERERLRRQANAELARNEERLRLALGAHDIGIFEVDYGKGTITLDAVCARIMNLGEGALELDAGAAFAVTTAKECERIGQFHDELRRGLRADYSMVTPLPLADGGTRWVRHHGVVTAERAPGGMPVRMLGVLTDITRNKLLEDRNRLAANVIDNSSEAIMILDANGRVIMTNRASTRITGMSPEAIIGQDGLRFQPNYQDGMSYQELCAILAVKGAWQGEVWRTLPNGESHPALASVTLLQDAEGATAYTIVQEIDISAQKQFEQRIRHLAYRDVLTELPNRALLRDRVEQSVAVAARENSSLALLFLDLDHFKNINDSLGHGVGDRLLMEIARRLSVSVRDMDTVGRLGGDEFLILLPDGDADAAAHVAQKLLEDCSRPFKVEGHALTVTPSIGIALYPKDGTDFDGLLKSADTAMYRAKDAGRNAYRFYTPEMNQAVFQRMVLESSLRRAVGNDEFLLHYQPKFELDSGRLVGVEALIRWQPPEMGMIAPGQFIPVAEESDLIESIGAWVVGEACRQAKAWRQAGLPPLRVAVNFSARQFAAGNIVDLVAQNLAHAGLPGDALEIEITESLLAQDMGYTLDVLRSFKRLGVHVAVDDFGTGYSSLSYLKRFPIDRLKIDQSFVRDLARDADDRAIAAAVVTMGHSLGMRVIAEGVETARQMDILREMGCDEVQGYYLGRPIAAADMSRALRDYYARFAPPE